MGGRQRRPWGAVPPTKSADAPTRRYLQWNLRVGAFAILAALTCGCQRPTIGAEADDSASVDSGETGPGVFDSEKKGDSDTDTGEGIDVIPDAPDPSEELFSDDTLPEFTITLTTESASLLQQEYAGGTHQYVEATFIYKDVEYGPVGLRLKGENSFQSFRNKPSMKIKFDKYVDNLHFLELKDITLNNMDNDYTMMHERLAYKVYREFGIPAYRANHALVNMIETSEGKPVSERFYGLYALLEDADQDFIARWFKDSDGTLFEQWDVDFYDGYIPCPNLYGTSGCFELEYGKEDRNNLQGVADAMELSGQDALDAADAHLSWEGYLNYWAVGSVITQFDAYPFTSPGDDCHIYDDPTSGQLWYIPHGNDESFYYSGYDPDDYINGLLSTRCLSVSECVRLYRERIWQVQDKNEEWDWLGYFDAVHEQISEWVEADENKAYSTSDVYTYQSYMRSFIANRPSELESYYGANPND